MGGLLYKDFVSVNNLKKIKLTWIIGLYMVVFTVFRIIFPGTNITPDLAIESKLGQENLIDLLMLTLYACFVILCFYHINSLTGRLLKSDNKNKIKGYIATMPFEKTTYVASKYVFIGIFCYAYISLSAILGLVCVAFCKEGYIINITNMLLSMIVILFSIVIFIAAIEIPFYMLFPEEIAKLIIVSFLTIIVFVALGYFMFGDLSAFGETFNLEKIMAWTSTHQNEIAVAQALAPAIVLLIYYLSYRITCHFYIKRED